MQELFAYCDESGNTGHDLFATGQPFYVLACPLFPKPVDAIPAELLAELRESGIGGEVKGSTLIGAGHTSTYRSIADWANRTVVGVCVSFIEKRYMAACKLLDIVFDPTENPASDPTMYWNAEVRETLGEALYDLPPELLKRAWDAYLKADATTYEKALTEVEQQLPKIGLSRSDVLALQRAITYVRAHASSFVTGNSRDEAPPLAAFVTLLQGVERVTRNVPGTRIHFVHDEARQFEPILRKYHTAAVHPGHDIHLAFGNDQELHLPIAGLPEMRFELSGRVPGLQVADLFAYSLQCFLSARHKPADDDRRRVPWEHGRALATVAHSTGLLFGMWSARGRGFRESPAAPTSSG